MLSKSGRYAWVVLLGVTVFGAMVLHPDRARADQRFYQCDRDGDDCRLVECDWDGDDCHVLREGYGAGPGYYPSYGYYQPPVVTFYWNNGDRREWR